MKLKRALVSVSEKSGVVELAKELAHFGVEIISTGGTAQLLRSAGIDVTPIEKVTGNPEAFGGRMKTISFQIGSGLLFRRQNAADQEQAKKLGIPQIDLVVCNLYPFEMISQQTDALPEWIENIDIGGPNMIRAAAKNYESVACLVDPEDYSGLIREIKENQGETTLQAREKWALKAFQRVAAYDLNIAYRLSQKIGKGSISQLRYGENPHQSAAFLPMENVFLLNGTRESGWPGAKVLQGKEISYNNWLDSDTALKVVSDLSAAFPSLSAVAILKHGNPCGVACHSHQVKALESAWQADSVSAFGGILAFSRSVSVHEADFLKDRFVEVLIAPDFEPAAIEILSKKKNLRLIRTPLKTKEAQEWTVRSVWGGLLCQQEDQIGFPKPKSVTKIGFSSQLESLSEFAWKVNRYLKSNCIGLYTEIEGGMVTLASGTGQPNRLDCIRLLIAPRLVGKTWNPEKTILVSDAFFPFKDSVEAIQAIGVKWILQPGGSVRDDEVIAACNELGLGMAFTGIRNFRH